MKNSIVVLVTVASMLALVYSHPTGREDELKNVLDEVKTLEKDLKELAPKLVAKGDAVDLTVNAADESAGFAYASGTSQWTHHFVCGIQNRLLTTSDTLTATYPQRARTELCLKACFGMSLIFNMQICCRVNYDWNPARCHIGLIETGVNTNDNHWALVLPEKKLDPYSWRNSIKCDISRGHAVVDVDGDQETVGSLTYPQEDRALSCLLACQATIDVNSPATGFQCCRINYDWNPARCHVGYIVNTPTGNNHYAYDLLAPLTGWVQDIKCSVNSNNKVLDNEDGEAIKTYPQIERAAACQQACTLTTYECCRINYDWSIARCHGGYIEKTATTNINHYVFDNSGECPKEMGYCTKVDGSKQTSGVVPLGVFSGASACLNACKSYRTKTGCEAIEHRAPGDFSCYLQTKEIVEGNGNSAYRCWVFSKCTGAARLRDIEQKDSKAMKDPTNKKKKSDAKMDAIKEKIDAVIDNMMGEK